MPEVAAVVMAVAVAVAVAAAVTTTEADAITMVRQQARPWLPLTFQVFSGHEARRGGKAWWWTWSNKARGSQGLQ